MNGVISPEAASELDAAFNAAVKAIAPYTNDCVESLGVPNIKELHSPIARDYVAFNAQNDNENFEAAGEMFDFTKTGTMRAKLWLISLFIVNLKIKFNFIIIINQNSLFNIFYLLR